MLEEEAAPERQGHYQEDGGERRFVVLNSKLDRPRDEYSSTREETHGSREYNDHELQIPIRSYESKERRTIKLQEREPRDREPRSQSRDEDRYNPDRSRSRESDRKREDANRYGPSHGDDYNYRR